MLGKHLLNPYQLTDISVLDPEAVGPKISIYHSGYKLIIHSNSLNYNRNSLSTHIHLKICTLVMRRCLYKKFGQQSKQLKKVGVLNSTAGSIFSERATLTKKRLLFCNRHRLKTQKTHNINRISTGERV